MYASVNTFKENRKKSPSNVDITEKCQIAKFDQIVVQGELKKKQRTPLRQLMNNLRVNIIGQTWPYLLAYVILHISIQIAYQTDLFCSNENRFNMTGLTTHKRCVKRAKAYFVHWDNNAKTMTKIITFLLGFYVSMIGKRWWDQVSKLPDADNLGLILGGLVWPDLKSDTGPKSQEAALHFKKTIIRYALLSWTMCLSRISTPLRNDFSTDEQYIAKGLLRKGENNELKIDSNDPDCTSQWWVPLSWAISMVNNAFNTEEERLIPKDHKDVVSAILKLRNDLHILAEYRLKPLPAIYKQAVWAAVFGWMLMGISADQNTIHYKDANNKGANLVMIILLGFPVYGILKYMLIFGWLKIADILNNPFGNDENYDFNLAEILDLNIWQSSITLENQEKAFRKDKNFLRHPYRIDEATLTLSNEISS